MHYNFDFHINNKFQVLTWLSPRICTNRPHATRGLNLIQFHVTVAVASLIRPIFALLDQIQT